MSIRPVKRVIKSKPAMEGAGVHLRRAFGFLNTDDFDPFLLLDDLRNDVPEMNTQQELRSAFEDLGKGTFLKG